MWFVFALGSAVFAALTSILAKIGIEGVNSNLATAIRTVVVVVMAWVMVFLTNTQGGLPEISRKRYKTEKSGKCERITFPASYCSLRRFFTWLRRRSGLHRYLFRM